MTVSESAVICWYRADIDCLGDLLLARTEWRTLSCEDIKEVLGLHHLCSHHDILHKVRAARHGPPHHVADLSARAVFLRQGRAG